MALFVRQNNFCESDHLQQQAAEKESGSGLRQSKELDGRIDASGNYHRDHLMIAQRRIALLSLRFQLGDYRP